MLKDLVVDRSAFDRIMAAGGYISTNTGSAPDANNIIVPRHKAECAMDAATCIGCGACVAACPKAISITHIAVMRRPYIKAIAAG